MRVSQSSVGMSGGSSVTVAAAVSVGAATMALMSDAGPMLP